MKSILIANLIYPFFALILAFESEFFCWLLLYKTRDLTYFLFFDYYLFRCMFVNNDVFPLDWINDIDHWGSMQTVAFISYLTQLILII